VAVAPESQPPDSVVAALVRDGYDRIADRYAEHTAASPSPARLEWTNRLLARLVPRSRVLDLGCGPGVPTGAAIVGEGHHLTGVDISARQIALARQQLPPASFIQGDVVALEFPDGAFEAAVALYSLSHVPRGHWPDLFCRVHRWLRPEGLFLACFPPGDQGGWLEDDFLGFGGTSWTNSFDTDTTSRLLGEAGLEIEAREVEVQNEPWGLEQWMFVLCRRS
jgi:SAM-dependent methyltransferase